jgi:hypothetical protein
MTNPLQGLTLTQLATQAHNQFGHAYNAYAQQSMHPQYAAQQRQFNADAWPDQRYMIEGKYMTLQEFVDFMWPEDCADKTFFLLKHTKET